MGAAMLLVALAATASFDASSDPARVFQQVCTYGEGRFTGGSAREVRTLNVNKAVRNEFRRIDDKAYRLELASGPAFLLIGNTHAPNDPRNTRTCVLATRGISFVDAVAAVQSEPGQSPASFARYAGSVRYEVAAREGYLVGVDRLSDEWVAMKSIAPGKGSPEAKRLQKIR